MKIIINRKVKYFKTNIYYFNRNLQDTIIILIINLNHCHFDKLQAQYFVKTKFIQMTLTFNLTFKNERLL